MKPLDGVVLSDLVDEVVNQTLEEKRRGVAGLVKELLQKSESLTRDIAKDEAALAKKRTQLDAVNYKILQLKKGDWSALQEKEQKSEQSGQ